MLRRPRDTKQSAFLLKQNGAVDKRYGSLCISQKDSVSLANYFCGSTTDVVVEEGFYPWCPGCKDKPAIKRRV